MRPPFGINASPAVDGARVDDRRWAAAVLARSGMVFGGAGMGWRRNPGPSPLAPLLGAITVAASPLLVAVGSVAVVRRLFGRGSAGARRCDKYHTSRLASTWYARLFRPGADGGGGGGAYAGVIFCRRRAWVTSKRRPSVGPGAFLLVAVFNAHLMGCCSSLTHVLVGWFRVGCPPLTSSAHSHTPQRGGGVVQHY